MRGQAFKTPAFDVTVTRVLPGAISSVYSLAVAVKFFYKLNSKILHISNFMFEKRNNYNFINSILLGLLESFDVSNF